MSILYAASTELIKVALPRAAPPSGRSISRTLYLQEPVAPLKAVLTGQDLRWHPSLTDIGNFWQAEAPCEAANISTITVKRMMALEVPRLLNNKSDAPLGWNYHVTVQPLANFSLLCRLRIDLPTDEDWGSTPLTFDACNWELMHYIINGGLPALPYDAWYVDIDGSLVLSRKNLTSRTHRTQIEIEWELLWSTIDAFNLFQRGLALPVLRSHRVLSGAIKTSISGGMSTPYTLAESC